MQKSEFDGGVFELLCLRIGTILIIIFTLGIATPWALCLVHHWRVKHTIIEGRRLNFTGTGGSLFGHWLKWLALTVITLGIYGIWVPVKLLQWEAERTSFVA